MPISASKAQKIGKPTKRDQLVERLKDACQAAALHPAVAPFAVGLSIALGMVQKQGEESLRAFVTELSQDFETVKEKVNTERMDDPAYRARMVKVFRAVQFEQHEEKRRCYRAALLNSLTEEIGRHPEAQHEFMLSVLESLGIYAIMTLKVLNDPQAANREYNEALAARRKARPSPVTLWEMMFVFTNEQIEQPTFEAMLTDLASKRLIDVGQISQSPRNVMTADLMTAPRVLTDFGREFVRFVTLPPPNG